MIKKSKQISGADLRFENITKKFGDVTAVDDVSIDVRKGSFVTLLGPSGSGKTTILNMVAGFEKPTHGTILMDDHAIEEIPPYHRNIGMVFQNYALFPHMTVFENIAFPLATRKVAQPEIASRVEDALTLVKLQGYGSRFPKQLSGGQQQRVALARSIIFEPPVLLMDEPLGALDKKLREHMQLEIKHLHEELGMTVIYVTHDQGEALTMSDEVVLLNLGQIEQSGKPDALYDKPRNKFVADFIGETNLLAGKIIKEKGRLVHLRTDKGVEIATTAGSDIYPNDAVSISLRPEKVLLITGESELKNIFSATLVDIIYVGETTKLKITLQGDGEEIFLKLQNRKGLPRLSRGDEVRVGWDIDDMTLFQDPEMSSERR